MSRERMAEGFLRGTLVLTVANLATRLLGVVYWPVVTRIFALYDGRNGDAGAGLARVPLASYQIILAFSSSGFNVAIAKLMAERLAVGDATGAHRVFRVALALMGGLGLLFTAGFWWGAPVLATWMGQPDTAPGFLAMAPAMVLMSLTAAYRGLFQGFQYHTPNGASLVVEQVVRVVTGVALLAAVVPRSLILGAAAVNFSDVPGALAALAYLYWVYRQGRPSLRRPAPGSTGAAGPVGAARPEAGPPAPAEPAWAVVRRILAIALPISLIGAVMPLMAQADTILVNRILGAADLEGAQEAFGWLTNATQLVWAPTVLTGALYVSLVPAMAEAVATGNLARARDRAGTAYRVTLLFGLPAAAGLWALADPFYRTIYGGEGGPVLAAVAWSTLFLMLQQTSSGLLQGAGRVVLSTRNLIVGAAAKVALTYLLLGPLGMDVRGAAYASIAGYATIAGLNIWQVHRHLGAGPDLAGSVLKPGAAAGAMALALWLAGWLLPRPGALATVGLALAGAVVYGLALLLLRGLTDQDLRLLPGGSRVSALLSRLRLL